MASFDTLSRTQKRHFLIGSLMLLGLVLLVAAGMWLLRSEPEALYTRRMLHHLDFMCETQRISGNTEEELRAAKKVQEFAATKALKDPELIAIRERADKTVRTLEEKFRKQNELTKDFSKAFSAALKAKKEGDWEKVGNISAKALTLLDKQDHQYRCSMDMMAQDAGRKRKQYIKALSEVGPMWLARVAPICTVDLKHRSLNADKALAKARTAFYSSSDIDPKRDVQVLMPLAKDGSPDAQFLLAASVLICEQANGVKPHEALNLLARSVQLEYAPALVLSAFRCFRDKKFNEWERHLRKAAGQEVRYGEKATGQSIQIAQFVLGVYLISKNDTAKRREGERLLRSAAFRGFREAQYTLGLELSTGERLKRNPGSAYHFFSKAAEQGDERAIVQLALCHATGRGTPKDGHIALRLLTPLAEKGDIGARAALGQIYFHGYGVPKDIPKGVDLLTQAANKKHTVACLILGTAYLFGKGIPKDHEKGVRLLNHVAEVDPGASFAIGMSFVNGKGVEKNLPEAARFFRIAAGKGHTDAQNRLGQMLINGEGMTKDVAEGITQIRKAAEAGHTAAQFNLGYYYSAGEVVEKDDAEAKKWLIKAQSAGDTRASKLLRELSSAREKPPDPAPEVIDCPRCKGMKTISKNTRVHPVVFDLRYKAEAWANQTNANTAYSGIRRQGGDGAVFLARSDTWRVVRRDDGGYVVVKGYGTVTPCPDCKGTGRTTR